MNNNLKKIISSVLLMGVVSNVNCISAFTQSTKDINFQVLAEAVLEFIITSVNGLAGGNCYLKLIVGNDAKSEFAF